VRAILVSEPRKFGLVNLQDPKCGPGQVIVRTAFCGICGTDLEILSGGMPKGFVRYPVVPGHEWTGAVAEIGSEVTTCALGDRVSVEGNLNCGNCRHCVAGEMNLCVKREHIGLTQNGGFAEYVLAPAKSCHQVPQHIGLDEALMVEPAATVVRGIERANPKPGFTAAVIGCGPIGQIAMRVLGLYKPSNILGIDRSKPQESLALRAGANSFVSTTNVRELIDRSRDDGWDLVIDCAGGVTPIDTAIAIASPGGQIIAIGTAADDQCVSIRANIFAMKNLHIDGVLSYTTQSWIRTLGLVTSRELHLADLITHRFPLEEFEHAIELLDSRREPMGKITVTYPGLALEDQLLQDSEYSPYS
jgi:L-iditol 2-dehydrogenase